MNKTVRFYLSCHKPCDTIENEVIRPVQQNAVIEALRRGSDEDRFMADHANEYCELLTQYWAWKYEKADYYGFGHYRRLFSFRTKNQTDDFHIVHANYLSAKTAKQHLLDSPEQMKAFIENYDVIAPIPYSYEISSVYRQYKEADHLHIEDLDLIIDLIRENTPEYLPFAKQYLSEKKMFICNMFIMRRDLFCAYSEWLFGLLKGFYKKRDMAALHYNTEAMRTPGHLGERLFGIFYTKILSEKKYRTCGLNILMIKNTDPMQIPPPSFPQGAVPNFMATNAYYAKFTAAALLSLAKHTSPSRRYDIIILHNGIGKDDMDRLSYIVKDRDNISVRFFDPQPLFEDYSLYESATITIETYYRLIIPEYFPAYDKVLYLDSDLIVLDDVAKLYDTDIGDNYIGGAIDICHAGAVNGFHKDLQKYYEKFSLKNIYTLINAGVLLMNCKQLRKDFTAKYLLDFASHGKFRFQDQDLLNLLCEGKTYYFGSEWNFFGDPAQSYRGYVRTFAPQPLLAEYMKAKDDIRILHYAGNEKPWLYPQSEYAFYFWMYIRETPYYQDFFGHCPLDRPSRQTRAQRKTLRNLVLRLCPKGTRRRYWARKLYHFIKRSGR